MTSSVTIWTSRITSHLQTRVAQLIGATRVEGATYDSISIVGQNSAECVEKINNAFNRLVSLTTADSTLHILAVIPMYEDNTTEQLQTLFDACSSMEHNITLHILGLAPGICPIFEAKYDASVVTNKYTNSLSLIKTLCLGASFSTSYSLIDNYAENGAPIGFTLESISNYIALIQISLMQGYYTILSPSLTTAHLGDNISIGVASLSFNRKATTRQLLGLAFLEALDNVGINNKKVDAQKAAHDAELILMGISERYPNLFEKSIKPLYKDGGLDFKNVAAKASSILDSDIKALENEILSLLKSDTLSLPEKEAVLAMILGRDNESISGMQYDHEGLLLDDACVHPINLYVDAFNSCCKDSDGIDDSDLSGILPLRGDYEALKMYRWNESKREYEECPENFKALNPLHDIKRLKQEIVNITSFIRDKQAELNKLQESDQQRKDAEEIKNKWHKPQGTFKDIEYKQQPLDEQYIPTQGLKVKSTVDLRKFFTPVKNQKDLGSCTSFAAVAMYEAMMNIAGVDGIDDMSPAYLYYYSNILKGRPAGGSNFYEQLEVLGSHGVCHENLYIYDADSPGTKPSEQAENDAKLHRVISAKQIPLHNGPNKSDSIKRNHVLLTSALSEGYPIGISLKIYDNLGENGAFILHPDDMPNAKEDGWHAMVIVGYSEENSFYIVRNSWGAEFGEKGYCYIPTAYIDDPDYMNFACIITEISDSATGAQADIPSIIADFAATESEIRIATIRNAIVNARVDLKNNERLFAEYYKYYQRLVIQLTTPKVQNIIREKAEKQQTDICMALNEHKRILESLFVDRLKSYKESLLKIILFSFLIPLIFGIGFYFSQSFLMLLCFSISFILWSFVVCGYKWWIKIKRKKLQDELDLVAINKKHQDEKLIELQIRFHVAGMWLNRFHKLSSVIGNVYDRLTSYNIALRAWQKSYSRQIEAPEIPEGQMFKVLDPTPRLQTFFNQNKSDIVREVDFIKIFESYQIDPDSLDHSHKKLEDAVFSIINSLMDDFNIACFLIGDNYSYLNPVNLENVISDLINLSQPSYRNRTMNATSPTLILMADIPFNREEQWKLRIAPLFPVRPVMLNNYDSTTIILLNIHPQNK